MSSPQIKPATKKTFHFPKGAKETAGEVKSEAAATDSTVSSTKAAPKKSAGAKKTVGAEKAVGAKKAAGAKKATPKKIVTAKTSEVVKAPAAAPVEEKPRRAKKEKVVRDSFTMPRSEYARIAELKQRCLDAGVHVKKSELLRAGLLLLAAASAKRLAEAVSAVEAVKTGRPAKS